MKVRSDAAFRLLRHRPSTCHRRARTRQRSRRRFRRRGGAAASTQDDQESVDVRADLLPGRRLAGRSAARYASASARKSSTIDFALQLVRTARISGHVQNPDGSRSCAGNVQLDAAGRRARGNFGSRTSEAVSAWDGQFCIANVPPGLYTLRARNNDRDAPLSTSQPLSVASAATSTTSSSCCRTGGSLSGSLVFQPGSTGLPGDLTQIRITAPSIEPDDNVGPQPNPRVNKDGTFTIDGVSVGEHLIRANGGGLRGWNLKSVTDRRPRRHRHSDFGQQRPEDQQRRPDLHGQDQRDRRQRHRRARQSGHRVHRPRVLDEYGGWRPNSRQIATARPDQTGMFKIRNLPSGEYYVVTIDPSEPGEWFEPAYLDQHRTGAARMRSAMATQDAGLPSSVVSAFRRTFTGRRTKTATR